MIRPLSVTGSPAGPGRGGAGPWREKVAAAVQGLPGTDGVGLAFTLEPGRWIDLDTVTEVVLAGLRDGGLLAPRFTTLDAFCATKAFGLPAGVDIVPSGAAGVRRQVPPGSCALDLRSPFLPRSGARASKRAWRAALAAAWGERPPLEGAVWVDVACATRRSLVSHLETILDGLEPVLGRDPRGRPWQEFFPNDDRITWLRTSRELAGPALRIRLGPVAGDGSAPGA